MLNVVMTTTEQKARKNAVVHPFLNVMIREGPEAAGLIIENPSGIPFIDSTMLFDRDGGKI